LWYEPSGGAHGIVKIFFMGNNRLGWRALGWLRGRGTDVVGIAVHPPERRRHGDEILAAANLPSERIFDASRLRDPGVQRAVAALGPDMGLSVLLGYILAPDFLGVFPRGVVNLHPALLPYNRGAHPNIWSIVERTPAGVTLHWIDSGVDTGDVIAQAPTDIAAEDTGETLYRKLEDAALALLQGTWPAIEAGAAPRRRQTGPGTTHRARDLERIDEIDLDRSYRARDLLDLLRARTFPPHKGAFFRSGGKRVYVRVCLEAEE
jgi:methionyl-tRNA formyltransferase